MNWSDLLILIGRDALWSGIAALGFAILFNVPARVLIGCALCGASGHALRTLLMEFGIGIEVATLFGAMLVGTLGWWFARRFGVPRLVFTLTGAIPMVPGIFAYEAMISVIRFANATPATAAPEMVEAGINFVKTGLILAAIALGTAWPQLVVPRR